MLKTKEEIIDWLEENGVTNYTIKRNLTVNVAVDVNINRSDLKSIDVKFNIIKGDFLCNDNELTTLEGCPKKVKGSFNCSNNKLKTLEGSPIIVLGSFLCTSNKLESLFGGPKEVKEDYFCEDNNLKNLDFIPEKSGEFFFCAKNLELGELQSISKFEDIKRQVEITKLKKTLDESLIKNNINKSKNKI